MHNCNLPLPTPKLGSFHHTLALSTSCPRVDMKGEILQGTAGLIKSQKANPETAAMQNILCLLCHARCSSPGLWVSVSHSHITREAVLGYSGPNHTGYGLPLTFKISPCLGWKAVQTPAGYSTALQDPTELWQPAETAVPGAGAQLSSHGSRACSQSSAPAQRLAGQPQLSHASGHGCAAHGCVKTS